MTTVRYILDTPATMMGEEKNEYWVEQDNVPRKDDVVTIATNVFKVVGATWMLGAFMSVAGVEHEGDASLHVVTVSLQYMQKLVI